MNTIEKIEHAARQPIAPGIIRMGCAGSTGEEKVFFGEQLQTMVALILEDITVLGGRSSRLKGSEAIKVEISYDQDEAVCKLHPDLSVFLKSLESATTIQQMSVTGRTPGALSSLALSAFKVIAPSSYERAMQAVKTDTAKLLASTAVNGLVSEVARLLEHAFAQAADQKAAAQAALSAKAARARPGSRRP